MYVRFKQTADRIWVFSPALVIFSSSPLNLQVDQDDSPSDGEEEAAAANEPQATVVPSTTSKRSSNDDSGISDINSVNSGPKLRSGKSEDSQKLIE